jgi:uncharacterized FlgJ-related protein
MGEKKTLYKMKVKSDIDSDFKKYFDHPDKKKIFLKKFICLETNQKEPKNQH